MQVKKLPDSGLKLEDNISIQLDPSERVQHGIAIITDSERGDNRGTLINLPGEYELRGVIIRGFLGKKYLSFVIKGEVTTLYAPHELETETIKLIKDSFFEIDCMIAPSISKPETLRDLLGIKVWVTTEKPVSMPGLPKEKGPLLKVLAKKITPLSYLLT